MKKCIVFSDCDLDGIGTFLVFKWFTGIKNLEHEICSQSNFRKTFSAWLMNNKLEDYDKVYIFDLDVSQNNLDLVDHDNVSIIDHHDTHVQNKDKTLTDHQKLLILMVDDYDSYKLQVKGSYELNIILWNYVGQRAEQFTRDFGTGFKGFSRSHLNMIALNKKKVSRVLSELQIFRGKLPLNGKQYNLYATMASESLNEVAHHVINTHECDIIMVMNMNTKRVSFRMNKDKCPEVDLGKLASNIAEGGGHPYAAGGQLTDKVLTLTKLLSPVTT